MTGYPQKYPEIPKAFLLSVLLLLLADRLAYQLFASPLPDEAYYWLWAKHPDWSYFDHPPLQAWLIALSGKLFGHSLFALRAPTLLTTAALVWTIHWWVKRSRGTPFEIDFLTALTTVAATPLIFVLGEIMFHDHLLIALLSLATIPVFLTFETFLQSGKIAPRHLYTAAILIGLAGLTKYNAAIFALGIAAAILVTPKLRPMFRSAHLYLAALVMLACLSPVFYWNLAHAGASFQYNLEDRLTAQEGSLGDTLLHVVLFVFNTMGETSPFLAFALVSVFWKFRKAEGWFGLWRKITVAIFTVSLLYVAVLTNFTRVNSYWNIQAYIFLLPVVTLLFGRRWQLYAHLVYGAVLATLFTINFTLTPIFAFNHSSTFLPGVARGWPEITEKLVRAQTETGADFLATSDYRTGSILAFWLDNPDIEVLSQRHSQFDYWSAGEALRGQNAVILAEPHHPLADTEKSRFTDIKTLETFSIVSFGNEVAEYTIYFGQGYQPPVR